MQGSQRRNPHDAGDVVGESSRSDQILRRVSDFLVTGPFCFPEKVWSRSTPPTYQRPVSSWNKFTPRRLIYGRDTFTKTTIEAIPNHDLDSPSREVEYSDSEMVGLKLRVSKNGRRFLQHRYSFIGKKRCLSMREFPHVTVQEARKKVSEKSP